MNSPAPEFTVAPANTRHSFGYWLKQFLAGNPFYIVSAGFLLYGIYRVSIEPEVADRELRQLLFNFGSLEFYGLLLTATALFLASRRIWYDSTLLVVIQSSIVLIPYLLVSQAISLKEGIAYLICGMTTFLAGAKFSALRKFYPALNLPGMLLLIGSLVMLLNSGLPVLFKSMQDARDAAYALDIQEDSLRWATLAVLPVLAGLAMFLPYGSRNTDALPPQNRWLPLLVHSFWILGTGVHLYSIQYVYRTPFEAALFMPAAWVLCWVMWYRLSRCFDLPWNLWCALFVLPLLVALPLFWSGKAEASVYLLGGNVALYMIFYFRSRTTVTLHLGLISLAAIIGSVFAHSESQVRMENTSAITVFVGVLSYAVLAALVSSNPKFGVVGALCVGLGTLILTRESDFAFSFAVQAASAFALLHSLSWRDYEHQGAKLIRIVIAVCWTVYSIGWAYNNSAYSFVVPAGVAAVILAVYAACVLLLKMSPSRVLLIFAVAVLMSTPVVRAVDESQQASMGLGFVISAFILFAIGTWYALRKTRVPMP